MSTAATSPPVPAPEFMENAGFRQFTVDEYHQMIKAGILIDGEPIELLEGWMVKKMAHGTPHDCTLDLLEGELLRVLPATWFARSQRAVTLSDSEPEPDIAIVRSPRNRYKITHTVPDDIALLIEVSDSSLRLDRIGKGRIYSRAGIPVYWVVNVVDKVIEVYTQPGGTGESAAYTKRDDFAIGTTVPVVLDGNTVGTIAVNDVFG
jgi:Uma2 family endonuclease